MHGEDFAGVFLPRLHGELGQSDVEELDRAIAAGREDLILVRFRPRAVKERVLGVEPSGAWSNVGDAAGSTTHHFSATIPFAVRPKM